MKLLENTNLSKSEEQRYLAGPLPYFSVQAKRKLEHLSTGSMVGIDVGLKSFYTDSDGNTVDNPRHYRKAEKQLKRLHRLVSRKNKGSKNRKKARKALAKGYLKVQRQREDFARKTANALVTSHDLIAYEHLQIRNMVKNHKLAKSIHDAAWGQFLGWMKEEPPAFDAGECQDQYACAYRTCCLPVQQVSGSCVERRMFPPLSVSSGWRSISRCWSLQPIALLDQTMTHGFRDGLRPISDLQLAVDILHLTFDLDLTPVHLVSDLFIRPALRCQSHYLDLCRAESPIQAILLFGQSMKLDDHLCHRLGFTEHALTAMHSTQSPA